jgi:hypothetical protein
MIAGLPKVISQETAFERSAQGRFFCGSEAKRRNLMKKLRRVAWCFSLVQLFFCPSLGHAMNVTLGWEANTESHLAGYKVYYDTNSGAPYAPASEDRADNYPNGTPIVVEKSVTEITLTGLTDGKVYYFAVTAFDDEGRESAFSNEVVTDTDPPGTVTNLSSTPDIQTWSSGRTATVNWSAARDGPLGSGVAGYSVVWDANPGTIPDTTKDMGPDSTSASAVLSDGQNHWFHIRAVDGAGYWGETVHYGPFYIDGDSPYILNYPSVDFANNTMDVTFSDPNVQNALAPDNYRFSPSLNIVGIAGLGGGTYRLTFSSLPRYMIFTLTVSDIRDAVGNLVSPDTIIVNDDDRDSMSDDWEERYGIDDPNDDPDADGVSNAQEFNGGGTLFTDPHNPDTDGDTLPDGWELSYGTDPLDDTGVNGRQGDPDGDGWTNHQEYEGGTDPGDPSQQPTGPSAPALRLIDATPHYNAGIDDATRVANNTSFYVRVQNPTGIDITDPESIRFTIDDGAETYTRDLSDPMLVSVINLSGEDDTRVTDLWVAYHRAGESQLGNYAFDTTVNIRVDVTDRTGVAMDPGDYRFKIETEAENEDAAMNAPASLPLEPADPDIQDPDYFYDAGIHVEDGELMGAKVIYDSTSPVTPTFGPSDEIPSPDMSGMSGVGMPMNLQPSTVFTTPVKVFIPCPGYPDVSALSISFYNGREWVLACDSHGNVLAGGEGWMVPGSRVDHPGSPGTIEIKIYHFSALQAIEGYGSLSSGFIGCFIGSATRGTSGDIPSIPYVLFFFLALLGVTVTLLSRKRHA